ncbi:MAG TPA: dihydrodipicolinate synthase family protein [Thermoplasmata archaeon]|nr:dihydrodipicolinate synthase family protein [Thermoplasmata archaeon]
MTPAPRPATGAGLLVALTTPFGDDGNVDRGAAEKHAVWLADHRMDGVIVGGSLGEGAALSAEERVALVRAVAGAVGSRTSVWAAVAAARTSDAVALARALGAAGARGLLVLPPYVYRGTPDEVRAHYRAVVGATDRPCLLYNNPPAYGNDLLPEAVLELAEDHPNLVGVKESGDVRRIAALRSLLGDRLVLSVGVDDAVVEGVAGGATGWVAGLANAFPDESRALFEAALRGDRPAADALYRRFLPLLRLDADPRFVQWIKAVEAEVGLGPAHVRPPRLPLTAPERAHVAALVAAFRSAGPSEPAPVQENSSRSKRASPAAAVRKK